MNLIELIQSCSQNTSVHVYMSNKTQNSNYFSLLQKWGSYKNIYTDMLIQMKVVTVTLNAQKYQDDIYKNIY